jgi:flagellin-like hook-associated protein FlgL
MRSGVIVRVVTALVAVALTLCSAWFVAAARADWNRCVDATCRVRLADGSCGSGCVFEATPSTVFVLTCAHVVEGGNAVACDFWRGGHQSSPIAGTVIARQKDIDAAVVAIPTASFGGRVPPAVPIAARSETLRPGDTLTSVGCAEGAWATAWKGHVLSHQGGDLLFSPPPANGRSGSAVFDAGGTRIVGIVRARSEKTGGHGLAVSVQALYSAFSPTSTAWIAQRTIARTGVPVQCGPGGCQLGQGGGGGAPQYMLPYRNRQAQEKPQAAPQIVPWPTLPAAEAMQPQTPPIDIRPLDEKLSRIAAILDEMRRPLPPAPGTPQASPPAAPPTTPMPAANDESAKLAQAAMAAVEQVAGATQQSVAEAKAEASKATEVATKAGESVGGLHAAIEQIKESLSENGTISQRFHARVDRVRGELEEKLGREATDREVRLGYVKDLVMDKVADGGAVGLAKALGLPVAGVFIVWLIARDIRKKRTEGDPLAVEKLYALMQGQMAGLRERAEGVRERVIERVQTVTGGQTTPKPPAGG